MATILIVDDHPSSRQLLVTLLSYKGHRVVEAADGAEGLVVARAERPDLVISDILMPTMDGYEFVRLLRADPALAQTPVVFWSVIYLEHEARALARACGVTHILVKPCDPQEVLRTVDAVLGHAPPPAAVLPPEGFNREHLRLVTDELSQKVEELRTTNLKLDALIAAGQRLALERDLPQLLHDYCRAARDIIGVRWVAIGMLDADGHTCAHFVTAGLSHELTATISPPQLHQGLFREVLHARGALQLHDLPGDPQAAGLPPGYPPVHSLLGATIFSPLCVYGGICFADKLGDDAFSADDERLATTLAAQLGVAYENARLYTEFERHTTALEQEVAERKRAEKGLAERTALAVLAAEVGGALTRDAPLRDTLQQCAEAMVRHLDVALARIWTLNDAENVLELQASAGMYTHLDGAHGRVPVGAFKIGLIALERRPHLTNAVIGDPRVHDQIWAAREGLVAFAGHPLIVAEKVVGVMALFARTPLGNATLEALAAVADQIAPGIERARAAAALRASEARYRLLFDANPLPLWVSDLETLRFLAVNEAAIRHYGYTRDEFRTMSIRDIRPAEDVPAFLEIFTQPMAATGQRHGTWRHRLRDGRLIDVDITAYNVLFADRPARLVVAHDITERKQAETRVQQQLARLALLHPITRAIGERQDLHSICLVVLRHLEQELPLAFACLCLRAPGSDTVTVTAVGPASQVLAPTVGLDERQVVSLAQMGLRGCTAGQTVSVFDTTQESLPLFQRFAQAGMQSAIAVPLLVENSLSGLLLAARREPQGFSSGEGEFLRQLSEHVALAAHQASLYDKLQQAYDDLHQSQQTVMQQERLRALGQMASGIAHDINNAISPITLYVESLLANEPTLSARARDYLTTVHQAANDVAHTVARLREFYRQPVSQQEAVPVDLNQIVPQVVDLTRARWRDEPQRLGLTIAVHAALQAQGLPPILGVESEVREALINLIFNAVDAMPQGGSLTLRTQSTPTAVVLEVMDTGIGMDAETRQRCLEPFYTTKEGRGTGLGLAMVYGITERHAAQLTIESTVGQGTTVRLLFPPAVRQGERDIEPAEVEASAPPRRILVVDDDPLLRRLLQDVLQTEGHRVTAVEGGLAGLAALQDAQERQEPFEVVITDLGMPEMDGREVARGVKRAAPDTPVIMLTGWGQALRQDDALPPYVDHLLSKPPGLRELRAALRTVTRRAGRKDTHDNH